MTKTIQLKNYLFTLISKWFPSEESNIKKNEQQIMKLLFYSNFNELSIQESLSIFVNVEKEYKSQIANIKSYKKTELTAINDFDGTNVQNKYNVIKQHVNNPVFDLPVKDFEIVEFNKI